ncbi:exocyst complex component 3-like protein 4 [Lates japonicus]|uniref:Exocyst complex component 3-like protein 4 n=1 Tax=Lates japonicus TaxID=270547 RepID=A0AAD3M5I6_LATJO|nr:exocyst complex component 3-like protein 4 [Lates japonicus]
MMAKSTVNPDEDTVSLKSNGKTPTNDSPVKEKLGMMQSLRKSIRHAAEKSPLSPGGKGSKGTPKATESGSQLPPSPSQSIGSPVTPGKDGDTDVSHPLKRSKTDPSMPTTDSFVRGSIRRSLPFIKRKKDPLKTVCEGLVEEMKEEKEEEEVVVLAEIEEMYTLPEIPHTPLSVMQISKLIETEVLEDAHLNLLALRREFQQEQDQSGRDSPMELAKKEKDLSLLYGDLRKKINTIVRDSSSLPSRNKGLLVLVARVIQEEDKRAEEPGGLPGSWMEAWREAVEEGVQAKVESVYLEQREQREQSASWLAMHLGKLGKTIIEDLESVKTELRWSYPPSFKVFSTYVRSYHSVVAQHLKKVEQQVTERRDLYVLLNWIINIYKSERIMGSLSLQPDMNDESTDLQLEENFLKQLKEKYCCRVKVDMRSSLDKIIELENEEFWKDKKRPEKDEEFLNSEFHMDIWTQVKSNCQNSRLIDAELELKVLSSCLEELKDFPKKFEAEFNRLCGALKPQSPWAEYQITYINSFSALQEHMDGYLGTCPDEVEGFKIEVKWLIVRLLQGLEDQFKEDVKPYLRRMMTRKWLTNDEDFNELYSQTKLLSQHCALMRPPHVQEFASRLHYHVVKEYIGQLMKNNYSCKNRKHDKAADKIRQQWDELVDVFEDMKSTS